MDKKIVFTSADNSGCFWYRSYLPSVYLSKNFDTSVTIGFKPNSVLEYLSNDVVILQRHCMPGLIDFIDTAHNVDRQVWFDIDDLVWDIPSYNYSRKHWTKQMFQSMNKIISKCDAVTTSTEPLAKYLKRFNDSVHVVPNLVENLFCDKRENEKVRILYAGSITHSGDFEKPVISALKYILDNYDIELYFVGCLPDEFIRKKYYDKVKFYKGIEIKNYIPTLQYLNCDISIMPLADNHFNVCKSALKYYESTLAGCVSIASKIYPYENVISHGVNGFLCKKYSDWKTALEILIKDRCFRELMYDSAKELVQSKYTWNDNTIREVSDIYKRILK